MKVTMLSLQIKLDKEKNILSIRDRGIGMTKEDFNNWRRLDQEERRPGSTGEKKATDGDGLRLDGGKNRGED
ncbi:hypothetical protein Q3G72_023596 [Acer saccharum]|nr:hypothetical protein Q3G72_023596 [Acer saccharum]